MDRDVRSLARLTMRGWSGVIVAGALFAASCSLGSDDLSDTLPTVTSGPATTASSETTNIIEPTTEPDLAVAPALIGELELEIIATHPHDPAAFTQGLELTDDGRLIEGTGLYGESDRRIVDLETGEVLEIVAIDDAFFGEGLTIVGDELIQLTWQSRFYLRADVDTLVETGSGVYDGEGWGLCYDGTQLVMSNGTPTLTFRDPETFEPTGTVDVSLNGEPLDNINELECVNGQVLANIWLTNFIVVIDPASGTVVATLDGASLRPEGIPDTSSFALNGIAHDPTTGRFFLTGKRWPVLYEVELSAAAS